MPPKSETKPKARRAPRKRANGNAPAIEAPADPLTDDDTARQVASWLKRLASQKLDAKIVMAGNRHTSDNDMPVGPNEPSTTYQQRFDAIDDQMAAIRETFEAVMPQVDELLEAQ